MQGSRSLKFVIILFSAFYYFEICNNVEDYHGASLMVPYGTLECYEYVTQPS